MSKLLMRSFRSTAVAVLANGADAIFAVSQQSFHPKVLGTGYEAKLLEQALQ